MIPQSLDTQNYIKTRNGETSYHLTEDNSQGYLNELFEELNNPMSFWQELRMTAMSGTDYVFVPAFVYKAFGPSYSVARFVTELSCAFSLDLSRMQIICIEEDGITPSYSKIVLEWSQGSVSHNHLQIVPIQTGYYDFIASMYQHSSSALEHNEH